uniref:Mesoderm development candidate 2 n=1 Tax=Parastrongyloides trichosuri TaxID=131310 RepID=A0A0N5A2A5_PARTI
MNKLFIFIILSLLLSVILCKNDKNVKKKDVRDLSDADLERILKEWDENDEDQDDDVEEDNVWKRKIPLTLDEMKKSATNEEELLKMSKKGQSVMMFVTVKDINNEGTSKSFTDKITSVWQGVIQNNHLNANVFVVEDNRAIFMFNDGSQAFEAKDFILKQKECVEVLLEGQILKGPASGKTEL